MRKLSTLIIGLLLVTLAFGKSYRVEGVGETIEAGYAGAVETFSKEAGVDAVEVYNLEFPNGPALTSVDNKLFIEFKEDKYLFKDKYKMDLKFTDIHLNFYEKLANKAHKDFYTAFKRLDALDLDGSVAERREFLLKGSEAADRYKLFSFMASEVGSKVPVDEMLFLDAKSLKSEYRSTNASIDTARRVYVAVEGDFPGEGYDFLTSQVDSIITNISKDSNRNYTIVSKEDATTSFTYTTTSYNIDTIPVVKYNGKVIKSERYVAYLTATVSIVDLQRGEVFFLDTVSTTSSEKTDRKSAMYDATKKNIKEFTTLIDRQLQDK